MKEIYVIRDQASQTFATPWFSLTLGTAMREFESGVTQPGTAYYDYPEHFSLYRLGTYEEESAQMDLYQEPEFIAKAVEFVERAKAERNGGHQGMMMPTEEQ